MTDYNGRYRSDLARVEAERVSIDGYGRDDFGGGTLTTIYYKMRAVPSTPGPFLTWVVATTPDYDGTYAPAAIVANSAVVTGTKTIVST